MVRFARYGRSLGRRVLHGLARVAAVAVLLAGEATAQERLDGLYYGLDDARGLTIQLQESRSGATGRITATDGSGQAIEGRREGGSIVSELIFRGKSGTARMTPKDLGLGFVWRPSDGSGGDVVFGFGRRGLELPPPSAGFVPENQVGDRVEPHVFVGSYEFWSPEAVTRFYGGIDEQYRSIIQLFPAVQTDVIWKLCQSPVPSFKLGEALRGEGVTCAEVDRTLKAAQKSDAFNRYKRRVHAERADAERAVQCAMGIHPPAVCAASARRTQQAATSLETVKTVLRGI